jgi:CheY-like chemotaxis protein
VLLVEKPHAVRKRVLVVDDSADSAQSLVLLLRIEGYDTRMALDGQSALRAAQEFDPAIVLLDISLPDMSGYEVAGQLRGSARPPATLIALSGYEPALEAEGAPAHFDHFLTKPVDPDLLVRLLAHEGGRAPESVA